MTVYALVFQLFLPIIFPSVICIDFLFYFSFFFFWSLVPVFYSTHRSCCSYLFPRTFSFYSLFSLGSIYFLEMELMTPWWEIVISFTLNRVVVSEKFSSRPGTVVWESQAWKTKEAKIWKTGYVSQGHLQEEHRSLGIRNRYMSGTRGKEGETKT